MSGPGALPSARPVISSPSYNPKLGLWENIADQIDQGTGGGPGGLVAGQRPIATAPDSLAVQQAADFKREQTSLGIGGPPRPDLGSGKQDPELDKWATPQGSFARPNDIDAIPAMPADVQYTSNPRLMGVVNSYGQIERQWAPNGSRRGAR